MQIRRRSTLVLGSLALVAVLGVGTVVGSGTARGADTASGCSVSVVVESLVNLGSGNPSMVYYCGTGVHESGGIDPVSQVLPITANRIWFHQNPDGSGWARCFEGKDELFSVPSAYRNPGNIQVVSNTASC